MIAGDLILATGDNATVYRVVDADKFGSIVAIPIDATVEEQSSSTFEASAVTYFSVSAITDINKATDDIAELTATIDAMSTSLSGALVTIAELETRIGVIEGA